MDKPTKKSAESLTKESFFKVLKKVSKKKPGATKPEGKKS